MNTLRPTCKILPACLWQRGLAAGVSTLKRENQVGACAEPLRIAPRQAASRVQTVSRCVAPVILLLGSGCSTNGRYHDGLDNWPVRVHSADSGSN